MTFGSWVSKVQIFFFFLVFSPIKEITWKRPNHRHFLIQTSIKSSALSVKIPYTEKTLGLKLEVHSVGAMSAVRSQEW